MANPGNHVSGSERRLVPVGARGPSARAALSMHHRTRRSSRRRGERTRPDLLNLHSRRDVPDLESWQGGVPLHVALLAVIFPSVGTVTMGIPSA